MEALKEKMVYEKREVIDIFERHLAYAIGCQKREFEDTMVRLLNIYNTIQRIIPNCK